GERGGRPGPPDRDPAALDAQAVLGEELNRRGIDFMLHGEDTGAERLLGVVVPDGDRPLHDDRPVVGLLVDEVNRSSGDLDAVLQRLTLRMEALEGRQQRRVDVHDPEWKSVEQDPRQETVETREEDELDARLPQGIDDSAVEVLAAPEARSE